MEQALSKGTAIARYFLIPFWQHSIHVHVYRYMYQCTVSPPPPPPPPPPRAGLPPPAPYSILCVCSCVATPNNATSTCMKIVWLLINNCSMNILKHRDILLISRYRRYRLKTISRQHCPHTDLSSTCTLP